MHVVLNDESGTIEVKGNIVSFYAGEKGTSSEAAERFTANEVTQLLRSRKDTSVAKIVTETGKTYVAKFDGLSDREVFVEAVVQAQAASRGADAATEGATSSGSETTEQWVSRAICQAAVDVGALSRTELQDILQEENRRGVVQAFDALEALVDRTTFRLKPLTETMENDVLRHIPVLAAIFERYVMDEETKRSFWEAVVRKYFCFSRTFLEEELEKVEQERSTGAAPVTAPADGGDGLSAINGASWRAMPKLAETTVALAAAEAEDPEADSDEARAVRASEAVAAGEEMVVMDRFVPYFRPKRSLCTLSAGSSLATTTATAPPLHRRRTEEGAVDAAHAFTGHAVAHKAPAEPTHKDALEVLRRFWRSTDAKQRAAVLAQYDKAHSGGAVRRESFIEATCLQQARAHLERDDGE